MRIGLDIDNVISNFDKKLMEEYKDEIESMTKTLKNIVVETIEELSTEYKEADRISQASVHIKSIDPTFGNFVIVED